MKKMGMMLMGAMMAGAGIGTYMYMNNNKRKIKKYMSYLDNK